LNTAWPKSVFELFLVDRLFFPIFPHHPPADLWFPCAVPMFCIVTERDAMKSTRKKTVKRRDAVVKRGGRNRQISSVPTFAQSNWPPARLSDRQLVPASRVCELLGGVSKMKLWRLTSSPLVCYRALAFPRPVSINNRNYFRLDEVESWIDRQAAAAPPAVGPGHPVGAAA
jgi:predicted DNA-binding transcriptional regulator AlpA